MTRSTRTFPLRPVLAASLLVSGAVLLGCGGTPADRDAGAAVAPASFAASDAAMQTGPVTPDTPGALHFILSPSGAGNYWGWQVQVLSTDGHDGFRPFLSGVMGEGESLRAEVFPGRYRLRVLLNGEVERDEWVEVSAGRPTVAFVDIGFLTNGIEIVRGEEARRLVAEAGRPVRDMRLTQTFETTPVVLPADEPMPAPQVAQAARPSIDGCTHVEGQFTADGGLSRLSFDGNGQGHMWQQTYGGTAVYTFDIDFRYSGTRDSMRFDYGPGIYKDAAGNIVDQKTIPGGDASCDYDGTALVINGKPFSR